MAQQVDTAKLAKAVKAAARSGSAAPAVLAAEMGVPKSSVRRLAKHPEVIDAAKRGTKANVTGAVRAAAKAAEREALSVATAAIAVADEDAAAARLRSQLIAAAEAWLATPAEEREWEKVFGGGRRMPEHIRRGLDFARDRGKGHDARRAIERRAELEREAEAKPATQIPTGTVRIIRVARPHLRVVDDKADSA